MSNNHFGGAGTNITPKKLQKPILTAQHYLQKHSNCLCHFDAILMNKADTNQIEWVRNAFDA